MRNFNALCVGMVLTLLSGVPYAADVPLPVMKGVTADSDARFDKAAGSYTYLYTARNGAASTGNIGSLFLDELVPTGTQVPLGWIADKRKDGSLIVSYAGMGPGTPPGHILTPGGAMQFSLTSPGQPVIRPLRLRADWIPEGEGDEDDATRALYAQLDTQVSVLGPGTETVGSYEHWSRFRDDLQLAAKLGWIPDAGFANAVTTQLAAARQAFSTQGARQAVQSLQALLATVETSTPAECSTAAFALIQLNTQALLAFASAAPQTAAAPRPVLQLALDTPTSLTLPIGTTATFTGRLTDRANDDKPVAGYPMSIYVSTGPDTRTLLKGMTDADGRFRISLQGKTQGTDGVLVGDKPASAWVQLIWKGGADLKVSWDIPPVIRWRGFGPEYMHDAVTNVGDAPAGPSKLRYYISATRPVDPKTARAVGERMIRALAPDESDANDSNQFYLQLPADLPPGIYYMAACADVDDQVLETDKSNNCGDSVDNDHGMHMFMMAVPAATTHHP